jgi:hypothetical protein
MLNIYGEKVRLTKAQKEMYASMLSGSISATYGTREYRTLKSLVEKSLVRISYAFGNGSEFKRYI